MLSIDQIEWNNRIALALHKANNENCPVLISEVIHINSGNPFQFFYHSKEMFAGERFYWRDPNRILCLAGSGVAYSSNHQVRDHRYSRVESEWHKLLGSSLRFGEQIEGTGPLLFGGFSFDPLKSKTELWKQFSDTHFFLPSYLLTEREEGIYLTINMVIDPNTEQNSIKLPNFDFLEKALSPQSALDQTSVGITYMEDIRGNEWIASVKQAIDRMKNHEMEKVVLAREVRLGFEYPVSIESVLHELLVREISSYVFVLESEKDCFIGATPERLVRKEGKKLLSTCLAGSTPRGKTNEEDLSLGEALLQDTKNRREHQIVVDMIKAALSPDCLQLDIPETPVLMKLNHIQHLYTPVIGLGRDEVSLLNLVERLHPTPALGGWPKEKSVEVIREIEPLDRGLYGGPLGWMDGSGNGEFVVAIRSALIQADQVSLFAGCGVVADSDPEAEYQETKVKIKPMLTALGGVIRE